MPFSITIPNLDQISKELKSYPKDIEQIIKNEFKVFGVNMSNDAKRLAPVNEGALRESINFLVDDMTLHVGAYIEYAAYLEFGTKSFAAEYVASLPEDWQAYAAEFKGSTGDGTFDDLLRAIMKWVTLKGIAATYTASGNVSKSKDALKAQEEGAYLIARKIVQKGIHAQPYLYPAFEKNKIELINNLKAQLNIK